MNNSERICWGWHLPCLQTQQHGAYHQFLFETILATIQVQRKCFWDVAKIHGQAQSSFVFFSKNHWMSRGKNSGWSFVLLAFIIVKKKWYFPTPIKVPMIAKQIHFFSLSIFHLKQYFKHFFPFLFFLPSLSPSLVPPSLTPLHLLYAIPSFLPSFPSHHWTPTQTIIPSSPLTSKSSFLYFHSFISFPCFFSLTFFLLPSFRPLKKAGCRESHFWNKRTMFSWRGRCF